MLSLGVWGLEDVSNQLGHTLGVGVEQYGPDHCKGQHFFGHGFGLNCGGPRVISVHAVALGKPLLFVPEIYINAVPVVIRFL